MKYETVIENGIEYEVRVFPSGTKLWYLNGELHREDGPAIEYSTGTKLWFLNGEEIESYYPNFGCFTPKTREEALERLNSKDRPYSYDLYMKDINDMFPVKG